MRSAQIPDAPTTTSPQQTPSPARSLFHQLAYSSRNSLIGVDRSYTVYGTVPLLSGTGLFEIAILPGHETVSGSR